MSLLSGTEDIRKQVRRLFVLCLGVHCFLCRQVSLGLLAFVVRMFGWHHVRAVWTLNSGRMSIFPPDSNPSVSLTKQAFLWQIKGIAYNAALSDEQKTEMYEEWFVNPEKGQKVPFLALPLAGHCCLHCRSWRAFPRTDTTTFFSCLASSFHSLFIDRVFPPFFNSFIAGQHIIQLYY